MSRPERKRRWDRDNVLIRSMRGMGGAAHFSPGEVERMRAMRAAGASVREIADAFDCAYASASRRTKDVKRADA